jgi:signal transduction histidine kinase
MNKILLLLEHKENQRLLSNWLEKSYEIFNLNPNQEFNEQLSKIAFDLCILDGRALDKFNGSVIAIKKKHEPVFLPFLLVTSRQDVSILTRHLWRSIDELIISPIEKLELAARVEMLLQRRQLSLQLNLANENLQELNDLKTRFISIASHELRNPLNLISGYAQLLIQNNKNNNFSEEQKQDLFKRIVNSGKKMTETLNSVLILTRGELATQKFKPAPLNLNEFCTVLVKDIQLGAGSNHIINLLIQGNSAIASIDQKLLHHILTNLLINAIKYSSKGSTIKLELIYEKEQIIFKVKDEGIGIPLKDQKQLFNSFHRASNVGSIAGTGLGLAIVKQSVNLHGGTVSCQSQVNVGTTFTVIFPLNLPQEEKNLDRAC